MRGKEEGAIGGSEGRGARFEGQGVGSNVQEAMWRDPEGDATAREISHGYKPLQDAQGTQLGCPLAGAGIGSGPKLSDAVKLAAAGPNCSHVAEMRVSVA